MTNFIRLMINLYRTNINTIEGCKRIILPSHLVPIACTTLNTDKTSGVYIHYHFCNSVEIIPHECIAKRHASIANHSSLSACMHMVHGSEKMASIATQLPTVANIASSCF